MANITLVSGVNVSIDETNLLQNSVVSPSTDATDFDDEDVANALTLNAGTGNDGDVLPGVFEDRLFTLLTGDSSIGAPVKVAVSGYSAANPTGTAMFTIAGDYLDLAFTDEDGNLLGSAANLAPGGNGNFSGLYTLDGTQIFLYTDTTNNNIVVGRKGTAAGTANAEDDTPNANGEIVLSAFLDDTAGSVKVWTVLRAPIFHDDPTTALNLPDEADDMAFHLYATATVQTDFVFDHLPSGQNVFLQFKDANSNIGIVVTGMDPDQVSISKNGNPFNDFDTVNTSQAADGTAATIATNNQSIDPSGGSIPDDEGMVFTFVKDPVADFTVPNLTQGEASSEANIQFGSLHEAIGAQFDIAQATPSNKLATVRVTALKETTTASGGAVLNGADFVDELLDDNRSGNTVDDDVIDIISVTVYGANGNPLVANITATMATPVNGIQVTFNGAATDNTVTIAGLGANYSVAYTTASGHNRVLIENEGNANANLNASFDIGGFHLPNVVAEPVEIGSLMGFEDDAPTVAVAQQKTVDEDALTGQSTGIDGGPGDVGAGVLATASGSLAGMFNAGSDGLKSFSLSDVPADINLITAFDSTSNPDVALSPLTSKGGTVSYDVDGNTLWAFVDAGASPTVYNAGVDRAVFKLELTDDPADVGTDVDGYLFTLLDQLDHPTFDANVTHNDTENDILLNLGSVLKITDTDLDFVTGAPGSLQITVDDDTPVVQAKSNLVYANNSNPPPNTDPGGTGIFSYATGADDRKGTTYSATNSDIGAVTLSGTVGTAAITGTSVVWLSETDSQAVFDVNYSYVSNNPTQGAQTVIDTETATLTFNKLAGTYTLSIPEIESFSILKTSTPGNPLQGYALDSATTVGSNPPISVMTLASDFFVQFEGFAEKNDPISFAYNGGLFSNTHEYVTVSTNTIGVSGDTVQSNEVIDLDFFTENPKGFVSIADPGNPVNPVATSKAVFVKMDGIGNEDLLVVLKLVDDNGNSINRTFIVDNEDIFQKPNPQTQPAAATVYGVTLDNNDGLMIFESNDYNFDATETYSIKGMQIVTETQSLVGSGYELNGAIDNPLTPASEGATLASSLHAFDATTDDGGNEPIKITDMGFVSSISPNAHLEFTVNVQDFDGDATGSQTLAVDIIGGSSVTATTGADTFVINDAASSDLLHMVMRVIDGGFDAAVDKLDIAALGSGTNYFENATAAADMAAFVTAADSALNGTVLYYFQMIGSDGYLAYDAGTNGITTIVQLVGVDDTEFSASNLA